MIPFTKAHACGNDFLIVTEDDARGHDRAELARRLCARNTGVGADGVEFFQWTGICAGRITLYNADGSTAEISGNGTRCVAAWMALRMDARAGDAMRIETDAGTRICRIDAAGATTIDVTTGMGEPTFARREVKLAGGATVAGVEVSMGNPHFVIVVDSTDFSTAGRAWQELGARIGAPVAILRLSGIYGPGRSALDNVRRGTARRIAKPGQVFNRIHVADVAQAIEAAFARNATGIFNVADDEPTPAGDPIVFAAKLLGVAPPPEISFDEAKTTMSPFAASFYTDVKRVRNAKLKSELGIALRYPSYREGLAAIHAADS